MKIKMLEHFQGTNQPTLAPNQEHVIGESVNQELADWLLEHRKAVVIDEPEPEKESIPQEKPTQGRGKRGGKK